jgi:hypothetical protein
VEALINGDELSHWHNLPEWKERLATQVKQMKVGGGSAVTTFSARSMAAWRMAQQALATTSVADGRLLERIAKVKNLVGMDVEGLRKYVEALIDEQKGLCALTELPLQFDGEHTDVELLASLDRIDSNGHYEVDNLQVVCRFANRWKGADENSSFLRLLAVLRND